MMIKLWWYSKKIVKMTVLASKMSQNFDILGEKWWETSNLGETLAEYVKKKVPNCIYSFC